MREIPVAEITAAVAQLSKEACCYLPKDVYEAFQKAQVAEPSPSGQEIIGQLMENADIARNEDMPICQDTGLAVIFIDVGQDVHFTGGSLEEAIHAGVAKGYVDSYLRKSSVSDPLFDRKNTKDNTPAVIHTRIVTGDKVKIKLAPKGAGSENKSAVKMLVPADGVAGVKKFVVDTVKTAGANSCPPMVVGVGIGGTMEMAAICSKRAAARDVVSRSSDERYAALEEELLTLINKTGIGP